MKKGHLANSFNLARLRQREHSVLNYTNPVYMKEVLAEELGSDFQAIRHDVAATKITVTEAQVEAHLAMLGQANKFDPAAVEFFQNNVSIYKEKALTLLNLIDKIEKRDYEPIAKQISDLDLNIDKYGYIADIDAKRLVVPTMYNIQMLHEHATKGNNYATYANFQYPHLALERGDLDEEEIYPCRQLQVANLSNELIQGNVPLSNKQAKALHQKFQTTISCLEEMMGGIL